MFEIKRSEVIAAWEKYVQEGAGVSEELEIISRYFNQTCANCSRRYKSGRWFFCLNDKRQIREMEKSQRCDKWKGEE